LGRASGGWVSPSLAVARAITDTRAGGVTSISVAQARQAPGAVSPMKPAGRHARPPSVEISTSRTPAGPAQAKPWTRSSGRLFLAVRRGTTTIEPSTGPVMTDLTRKVSTGGAVAGSSPG